MSRSAASGGAGSTTSDLVAQKIVGPLTRASAAAAFAEYTPSRRAGSVPSAARRAIGRAGRSRGRARAPSTTSRATSSQPIATRGPPSFAIRASVRAASCAIEPRGHRPRRHAHARGRSAPATATRRPRARAQARRASPAVVHVLPTASTIRARRRREAGGDLLGELERGGSAPNVPIGVAPPGGITIASRSRRATASAANGTSTTVRSRTTRTARSRSARRQFSIAHSLGGCGNRIAPASSPSARACSTVAIAWFEPYAPIAQIAARRRSRAWPSHASSVRTLLPP